LKVRLETLGHATVVVPEGRLDFSAAADFQKEVERVLRGISPAPAAVIIDGTALDYVSSAGLRVFLLAARAAQRAGIAFSVCALKPAVRDVFDLSGFNQVIALYADRQAALAQAPPRA
jgi:anti-sigma B factor antagonist